MILKVVTAAGLLAGSVDIAPPSQEGAASQYAQLIIRERVIVRVPARTMPLAPPEMRWRAQSAGKCISMRGIGGAVLIAPDKVDFILPGGIRIRAHLESSCPAIDYYNGFYLKPSKDGRICAGRDSIHARSGGECQIKRFRTMVPRH